jgi:anti-anti-sigma regulatory factor/anti-sigma regulatory factor (Ser/Thr protein kinase)
VTFECRIQRRYPVAVATLHGTLDRSTATDALAALQECVADEQPVGLVIDLTHLAAAARSGLASLATLARSTHRWPGTEVAVSGARPEVGRMVSDLARPGALAFFPRADDALAAEYRRPLPPRVRVELRPTAQAPEQGRELVAQACRQWRLPRLRRLAQLLASELVTNAVVHAGTTLSLTVRQVGTTLQVAVRDGDPRLVHRPPPAPGSPPLPLADTSRGLLLLETLADDWGCVPTSDGKVVWASMAPSPTE